MSNPQKYLDPFGLLCRCGVDVTGGLRHLNDTINKEWSEATDYQKRKVCFAVLNPVTGWDTELHWDREKYKYGPPLCCGIGKCKGTVTIGGKCYPMGAVNYWLWGKMGKLCGDDIGKTLKYVKWWKRIRHRQWFPDIHTIRWTIAGYYSKVEGVASDGLELKCPPCRIKDHALDYHIGWRKGIADYPKELPEWPPFPPVLLNIN